MDSQNPNKKYITIGVVLVIVAAVAYYYFYMRSDAASQSNTVSESAAIARQLMAEMNDLDSIKLDTAFINEAAFTKLTDITTSIAAEPVSRPNPFAPVVVPKRR